LRYIESFKMKLIRIDFVKISHEASAF
jgi:hypothetical protein